jgi:hypothetical protein
MSYIRQLAGSSLEKLKIAHLFLMAELALMAHLEFLRRLMKVRNFMIKCHLIKERA